MSESARDQFIDVLYSRGMIRPGEEWVIDANLARYAHELAEQIRHADFPAHATDGAEFAADLIDPSAGPVRPGEETSG
jgi:hypothetical protein